VTTKEVQEYYRATSNSEVRPELKFTFSISTGGGIAVDCGCGAGSNIKHLRAKGYTVYAYDIDKESIALCAQKYDSDSNVFLSVDSFGKYQYPRSSLIVADASLFFCPRNEIEIFFEKIGASLKSDGVFCGSFLGARDTMASDKFKKDDYWGEVLVLTEAEIKRGFKGFEILKWKEFEKDGVTSIGNQHHWHIYIVVAKAI